MPAEAQAGDSSPTGSEAHSASSGNAVTAQPSSAPRAGVAFEFADGHAFDAEVKNNPGSSMSSSSLYARLALEVPVGDSLVLSFPLDAAVSFYSFNGNPLLAQGAEEPWDQVRSFSVGIRGRFRLGEHVALVLGGNVASSGAKGASFNDTLSKGGTLALAYSFSRELTLGVGVAAQSQLEGGWYVLPFPVIEWAFDGGRWRVEAGALRAGGAAGVGLLYTPSEAVSFDLGLSAPGLGREFRLTSSSSIAGGVGRDSAFPVTLGLELRPARWLTVSAYGGLSLFHTVTLFDSAGNKLEDQDLKPSPVVGGRISLAL